MTHERYVTCWTPLDAVSPEKGNGTLVLLPANCPDHGKYPGTSFARPCGNDDEDESESESESCMERHGVYMSLEAGDVLVFSSLLFHCSKA